MRGGLLSINELVAIAVLAAFASGDYKTAGVVAFFMLMGEIIETRTAEGARASIESLIKLTPTKARRITKDGSEEEVAASELAVGDVIRIRPGDNVAADGVILSGQGSFNQATITGESLPADKKPGDEVFAGTQNLTGVLEIKVSRAGEDTTLGRVRELILAAEKTKLPIMKIVDQYMGFYTPLVLVIAALVWAFTHDLNRVIRYSSFRCPCAFILATPTAMVAALSAAARLGILIKNVADIERPPAINAFVFDKTGTLTTGELAVSRLAPLGRNQAGGTAALRGVGGKVQQPSHRQGAGATGRGSRGAAGRAARIFRDRRTGSKGGSRRGKSPGGPRAMAQGQRRDGGFPQVGGSERDGRVEPDLCGARRPMHRLGGVAGPDPRRGEGGAGRTQGSGVRRIAMISGDRQAVATRVAAGNRLRRGQGRVPAAKQGRVCARREGQGLSRGGGRRRCQ